MSILLQNSSGMSVVLHRWGARVQSVCLPVGNDLVDVLLGRDPNGDAVDPHHFGATIGRVANRIADGRFVLNNRTVRLDANEGDTCLHGGPAGFSTVDWAVESANSSQACFVLVSPHGDQGFPGTLETRVTYRLDSQDRLWIEFRAITDRPTVVDLTNHGYWNLAGHNAGDAKQHSLMIAGDHYLPIDGQMIPLGERREVQGTCFDFSSPRSIERSFQDGDPQLLQCRGFDHSWVLRDEIADLRLPAARLDDPLSGRWLELYTDQPCLHIYTGNFLDDGHPAKSGNLYCRGAGIALEAQGFPNSVNNPTFPSIQLMPGELYRRRICYAFGGFAKAQ